MIVATADQEFGINIPRIHDMLPGEQLTVAQRFLNERCTLRIMYGGRGGVHVRNQRHLGPLAGLGIVYHVAQPMGVPFGAIARIKIVGRFELFGRPG
jgi:hypothetical protein